MSPQIIIPHAQLIFVKGTSLQAHLIKAATQSPYSHCGFVIDGMTYEQDGGFVSRPISRYAWPYDLYDIVGMTHEKSISIREWCLKNRYTPYDYGKVIGMGLDTLAIFKHLIGWRSLLDSKRAMNCAEWCWESLRAHAYSFIHPQTTISPHLLSQDPVVKYLRSYPAYRG